MKQGFVEGIKILISYTGNQDSCIITRYPLSSSIGKKGFEEPDPDFTLGETLGTIDTSHPKVCTMQGLLDFVNGLKHYTMQVDIVEALSGLMPNTKAIMSSH